MLMALAWRMGTALVSLPSTSSLVPGSRSPKCSLLYLGADPGLYQDPRRPREFQVSSSGKEQLHFCMDMGAESEDKDRD